MGNKNSTSSDSGGGRGSGYQETNRRKKDSATNQTQGATKAVKKAVSFTQTKHPTEGIVDSYTFKDGKKNQMYGGQVSKATNDYLVSIGAGGAGKSGNNQSDGKQGFPTIFSTIHSIGGGFGGRGEGGDGGSGGGGGVSGGSNPGG